MTRDVKIVAIVITYFPDAKETVLNIKQYIDYIDKLIIWENTPVNVRSEYKITIPEYSDKIFFMSTDKNEGIAYPLNRCIEWAIKNNYSHILTMDQDSYWENFTDFVKNVSILHESENQCVITPNINHHYNNNNQFSFEKESFITSGTIFPLSVITRIGNFNEALFVEGVDLDYSLRVVENGIKIIALPSSHLIQNFGNPIQSKNFKFTTSNYSAKRTHNIVKNHFLIYRKYKNFMTQQQKRMIFRSYTTDRLIKIVLLEKDKCAKIYAILKGIYLGLTEPISKYFN